MMFKRVCRIGLKEILDRYLIGRLGASWAFASSLFSVALFLLVGTGCGDGTAPDDPSDPGALGLAVAVRIDSATFQQAGELTLELVPSTVTGASLIAEAWSISMVVSTPAEVVSTLLSQDVQPPDTTSVRAALLVDNSASMRTNDPDRRRAQAAQLVWNTVLQQQSTAQASLLYFGLGSSTPSPGFLATRLLRNWTSGSTSISDLLDTLQVASGSQIYTSLLDVIRWVDTTTAPNSHRAIVLLTDGILHLENDASASAVLKAAQAARVSIYPVGLGPASDRSDQTDTQAVGLLQELANGTGGIYAGTATPQRLSSTLVSLAASISTGVLLADFHLVPIPPTGTRVTGTVRLVNQTLGVAQGVWSFTAP